MLQISPDQRFLIDSDRGAPFFYLADTAWELFHRLPRADADFYLQTRAAQSFTVIQAVVLAEYGGLTTPNAVGALPLTGGDPAQPSEEYFRHVDWVVDRAAALGLVVGMLPSWGDKVNLKWGEGPEIFTPENAFAFGEFLGRRYADKPILWIVGGDRVPETKRHSQIWSRMAEGLRAGDGGRHLITFHPAGGHSSSEAFHDAPWLDFNMCQTGHSRNSPNYAAITADYARVPPKPVLDAEPGYEDHPESFNPENGFLDDYDVRKAAYWAVFAGACGHTYGCHDIWQFLDTARAPSVNSARTPWREALFLPGALQMSYLRALCEPLLPLVPDQSLLLSAPTGGADHTQAALAAEGDLVYSASGLPFTVDFSRLRGGGRAAQWFDPRTGATTAFDVPADAASHTFTPPSSGEGHDWVLILPGTLLP